MAGFAIKTGLGAWLTFVVGTMLFSLANAGFAQGTNPFTFLTLAGTPEYGPGALDGPVKGSRLCLPNSVVVTPDGSLIVADYGNHTIRKISPGGQVTTIAGLAGNLGSDDGIGSAARFNFPASVALDSAGNLYVADSENHTIRKIGPGGVVSTLAGSAGITGSTDGAGANALFNYPYGVAVDASGMVLVADTYNHTIRQITPAGVVTTLAGSAGYSGSDDGAGGDALFYYPYGVAVDKTGNVFVADTSNHIIRKIGPGGVVSTIAGQAGVAGNGDGFGIAALFNYPYGVGVDKIGNLLVADTFNYTIRMMDTSGMVTTLAGEPQSLGSVDGTGDAARFNYPSGVAADASGLIYVADFSNHTIRKISSGGVVTTVAGAAVIIGSVDGTGNAAQFNYPFGVAVGATGQVYVADSGNDTIRIVGPTGVVSTLAGRAGIPGTDDGTNTLALFNYPSGVALDTNGVLYVADTYNHTIRQITPAGVVTTLAGRSGNLGSTDGPGTTAQFNNPTSTALDATGNVYVADSLNHTIRMIAPGGNVTTLAGRAGRSGSTDGTGSSARFNNPNGVAVDSAGLVYVADYGNHTIRKIGPGSVVTTLAGRAGWTGTADGTNSTARFNSPNGVAAGLNGLVYVADCGNHTLRQVTPGGVVTTLGGWAGSLGNADGTGPAARFNYPAGVAVATNGALYVADNENHTIRLGTTNLCADIPVVDQASATVGAVRQLDTSPQTALAWQWRLIRAPMDSKTGLSASNIRNPTFTPDTSDLYVLRLSATNAAGWVGIRTVNFTAVSPVSVFRFNSPLRLANGQFQLTLMANTNQSYTVQVSTNLANWTDWMNIAPTNLSTTLVDVTATNASQRFYRAIKR